MAIHFSIGSADRIEWPQPDHAAELDESARNVEKIEARRDDEAVAQRRFITGRLARLPLGVDVARRVGLLLHIARQVYQSGDQLVRAVEPAAHAVHLARQSGSDGLLREALTTQSVILISIDNFDDALLCLDEASKIAERTLQSYEANFAVIANRGSALFQAFMLDDARVAFRAAEALTISAGDDASHGQVLCNLAACELELRNFDTSLALIRDSIRLLNAPRTVEDCAWRAMAEANLIRLLLHKGKTGEARERNVFAQHFAAKSGSRRAELAALGADGLCEIACGSIDLGRSKVLSALEHSRSIPLSLRNGLLTALQACEAAGDFASALSYQREVVLLIAARKHAASSPPTVKRHSMRDGALSAAECVHLERCAQLRTAYLGLAAHASGEAAVLSHALFAEQDVAGEGVELERVSMLAKQLAQALGLAESMCSEIESAAKLRDVGMSTVPRSLVSLRRDLSLEEDAMLRQHCVDGADFIALCDLPYRNMAADVARHHHEHWDGGGYPAALRGEAIPLAARIVGIADAFVCMTRASAGAIALAPREARREIEQALGTQFDPHLGRVFVGMMASKPTA